MTATALKHGERIVHRLVWSPQAGPQKAYVDCPLPEVFFGGTRGGGKTDGVLGKWALKEQRYGRHFNAAMFRKTTTSSEDAIDRSHDIFGPLGWKFNKVKLQWVSPRGGRVRFSYLESLKDAESEQGKNLTDAWVEEAGQHVTPDVIFMLFGALRSAHGVPIQLTLTANPGGPGQKWIAERYKLIPFPAKAFALRRALPNGSQHLVGVIPSRLTDNKIMLSRDKGYEDRLHLVGSPALVKAWLDGDWSAIEGAYFSEWSEARHIIAPFAVPRHWTRIRGFDWGSAAPFSVGWWAVASEDVRRPEGIIPKGALVRYREWYGASGPNKGLKMTAEAIADGIKQREKGETINMGVADTSIFDEDGGPSQASRMAARGVWFKRANKKRGSTAESIGGWDMMRARLVGTCVVNPDGSLSKSGRPMLYSFRPCVAFNQCIPSLQHDPSNAEDVDTDAEDHAADEGRYVCMSRPWVSDASSAGKSKGDAWDDDDDDDRASWKTT